MKKNLALILALCMVLVLSACGGSSAPAEAPAAEAPAADAPAAEAPAAEAPAAETYKITFSTGETYDLPAGEDLVFFFQCDAPGDMGAPNPGEEGAGITCSQGTVSYSNVGLGGPFSYPTSELVTISGITGDATVTVTDAALAMDATHTIYFDEQGIADAIAFAEEMAAQMAANPMGGSGEASGSDEASGAASGSGEASGGNAETDFEIELNGETVTAHYTDVDNGDQMTKSFEITVDDMVVKGSIDKGEWVADSGDAEAQAIVDAVHAAFDPNWSK